MSAKYDGGPAFPMKGGMDAADNEGMSLRDYFAGQALAGSLANADIHYKSPEHQHAAEDAYRYADAMLEARKR